MPPPVESVGVPLVLRFPLDGAVADGALRPGGNAPGIGRRAGVQARGAIGQRAPLVGADAEFDIVAVRRAVGERAALTGKNSVGAVVLLGCAIGQRAADAGRYSVAGIGDGRAVRGRKRLGRHTKNRNPFAAVQLGHAIAHGCIGETKSVSTIAGRKTVFNDHDPDRVPAAHAQALEAMTAVVAGDATADDRSHYRREFRCRHSRTTRRFS